MNKKHTLLFALLACVMTFFISSCSDDDDKNEVSDEWKRFQEQKYQDAGNEFGNELSSESGNGKIYYRVSDSLKATTPIARITKDGYPYITDSVVCRYKGWFFDLEGKRVVFDTTEQGNNSFKEAKFSVGGVIDGWTTILMSMKEGEEREISVPYKLGYRESGSSQGSISIPGYTTLFFTVKILKIIPGNPNEWDEE